MTEKIPAKRVDVVSLKMIKETSVLYSHQGNRKVDSPSQVLTLVNDFLAESDREKFLVICLNTKNEPTHISVVSVGTLNASIVHPREIYKLAFLANSNQIILCHNHPSGDTTPSQEDLQVTKRMVEAGNILGVSVLDHVIVGGDSCYTSFKEKNLI